MAAYKARPAGRRHLSLTCRAASRTFRTAMPDLDDELIARALQWCAAAGRPSSADQVRAALAPLSWDQLLAARALLADAPPARPLGPRALADLARGALPDVAAERERAG